MIPLSYNLVRLQDRLLAFSLDLVYLLFDFILDLPNPKSVGKKLDIRITASTNKQVIW